VFLAQSDGEEVVKVLDFGLAIEAGTAGPFGASGLVMGSPHYMSPEQARGHAVDARSDLWSLAVLAFQALTGELPFRGERLRELLVNVCTEPPLRPSSLVRGLPEGMDELFARALRHNPDERFQSAMEMAEAFAALAGVDFIDPSLRGWSVPLGESPLAASGAGSASGAWAASGAGTKRQGARPASPRSFAPALAAIMVAATLGVSLAGAATRSETIIADTSPGGGGRAGASWVVPRSLPGPPALGRRLLF
jgi:serine/threonine-protein kinase